MRVEQHPPLRPQHADHRGEGKDIGGVAGGQRGVVRDKGEWLEVERAHLVEQLGPGPADDVLGEIGDEARPRPR